MKTRRLTKKYKNKRNSKNKKSIKIKNKSRKRILKGGVRPSLGVGVVVSRTSGRTSSRASSIRPSSRASIRPSSRASIRPSSRASIRPSSIAGISKPKIPSKCCDPVLISYEKKILDSITDFPASFDIFYNSLLHATTPDKLASIIASIKQEYIKKTTLQPEAAYLNINGLKLVNFLRSKYKINKDASIREKIETIISLLDQHGMSQGVRTSDLEVIKKQVDPRYFECYKELYEEVHKKLFKCENNNCDPVSTSAVTLYCQPRFKPTLKPIGE